jgi:hypothetical protein
MTAEAWLERFDDPGYRWDVQQPPANESAIVALAAFAGRPVPADYVAFLRDSEGGAL